MPNTYTQLMESPTGSLLITANETAVTGVSWAKSLPLGFVENPNTLTQQAVEELKQYFNNQRQNFDVKIELSTGTDFQKSVWHNLKNIPFGRTTSYKKIAEELNSSPRAVGGAVGANPIPILIPCHRVVAENGMLTGFSGGEGIPTKIKLLELEGARS